MQGFSGGEARLEGFEDGRESKQVQEQEPSETAKRADHDLPGSDMRISPIVAEIPWGCVILVVDSCPDPWRG